MSALAGLFVGLTTLDLIQRVERSPGPDEKVLATRADLAAGGPATGAAVTFAGLGGGAVLLGAVGCGPVADLVRDDLARHRVRLCDAGPDAAGPAISAITVVEATGQRSVVSRNAEDDEAEPPPDVEALVAAADVVLVDGHHPRLALATAGLARQRGVEVVLDAGSYKPVLDRLLPLATMVVCSADFRLPDGRPPGPDLLDGGVALVAVTAGSGPVRWWTRHDRGRVDVPRVAARDTLGAGDAFHGAFAHAIAAGRDAAAALHHAAAVASLRVAHVGPRSWLADPALARLAEGTHA